MRRSRRVALALCAAIVGSCAPPPETDGAHNPSRAVEDGSFAAMEAAVIVSVNRHRRAAGLTELVAERRLTRAARLHAANMAARRELSHTLSSGRTRTLVSRVIDVGYPYAAIAENLGYGPQSAEVLVDGWMRSPAHRQNILGAAFTETGVGIARSPDGDLYHCQVFGRPRSGS